MMISARQWLAPGVRIPIDRARSLTHSVNSCRSSIEPGIHGLKLLELVRTAERQWLDSFSDEAACLGSVVVYRTVKRDRDRPSILR